MKIKSRNEVWLNTVIILSILFILFFIFSCHKDSVTIIETGSVTDIDGNVYKTVKIGKQWWMAENLKVKRYSNGDTITYDSIRSVADSAVWQKSKTGAYCISGDSKDTIFSNYKGKIFGFLYNWYAVSNPKNIAPAGWHVPADDEWKALEIEVGMNKEEADKVNWRGIDEGNKLKIQYSAEKKTSWTIPVDQYKIYGTNQSGFSALGGGCMMYNGTWGVPGANSTGFWWTASEKDTGAWYRYLDYQKANVFRFYGPKTYGFSIRCVKDNIVNE